MGLCVEWCGCTDNTRGVSSLVDRERGLYSSIARSMLAVLGALVLCGRTAQTTYLE